MQNKILFKELTELHHMQEAVILQKQTWGEEVISSLPQMVAAIHNGGSVIGVFDGDRVVGFSYGFTGINESFEKPYLVSHMMAIHPEYQNQGLGERLKFKQREWAIKKGYEKIIWTFDPLEIRNGYLNLMKLGGYVRTYIKSYYGQMDDKINKGMPSDRLLLEWDLLSPSVVDASKGVRNSPSHWIDYPVFMKGSFTETLPIPEGSAKAQTEKGVLVPVPRNIQEVKGKSPEAAYNWRLNVRDAVTSLFSKGYLMKGVLLKERTGYYVLEKTEGA
jgi:predicted GNAT superfamily acetyltransferase